MQQELKPNCCWPARWYIHPKTFTFTCAYAKKWLPVQLCPQTHQTQRGQPSLWMLSCLKGTGSMSWSCRHCVPAHLVFGEITNTLWLTSRATSSHLSSPRWKSPSGQWLIWKHHNIKSFIKMVVTATCCHTKDYSHWYQTWEIYVTCIMAHLIAITFIWLSRKDIVTLPMVEKKWPMANVSKSENNDKVSLHSSFFWTDADVKEIFYYFTFFSVEEC